MFLTVGIALGSWWAYYELGWGGWWFWDPVENASFMPWLVGTALIHSLAVTEKRGLFKSWTLLLAIMAFSLSLLGTFLVRSGVLDVRARVRDRSRRAACSSSPSSACASAARWRCTPGARRAAHRTAASSRLARGLPAVQQHAAGGRDGLILLGTLYPLFLDALDLGKISVGPPYFNMVFLVPMLPLLALLGVGMHAAWNAAGSSALKRPLTIVLAGCALPCAHRRSRCSPMASFHWLTVVGFAAAACGSCSRR